MNKTVNAWDKHYQKDKSVLVIPDENLVRMTAKLSGGKALDFGAGSGRHIPWLENLGFEVTALDFSSSSVKQLQKNYPASTTVLANNPPYDFADNSFDLVVNWGVLHYNNETTVKDILDEFRRILKPGGILVGSIRSDNDTFLRARDNKINLPDLQDSFIDLYSLDRLKNILSGFKEIQIGYTERTKPGDLEHRICHWIFHAIN